MTETATTVQCHQNKAFSHTQRYGNSNFFSVLLQLLSGGVKLLHELSGSETVRRDTLRHCDWIVAKLEEKL